MRKKGNAPCKNCEDRWVKDGKTCHSECEAYKFYREHLYDGYQERAKKSGITDYTKQRQQKIVRRRKQMKGW